MRVGIPYGKGDIYSRSFYKTGHTLGEKAKVSNESLTCAAVLELLPFRIRRMDLQYASFVLVANTYGEVLSKLPPDIFSRSMHC